jgi:hypothetical protein
LPPLPEVEIVGTDIATNAGGSIAHHAGTRAVIAVWVLIAGASPGAVRGFSRDQIPPTLAAAAQAPRNYTNAARIF